MAMTFLRLAFLFIIVGEDDANGGFSKRRKLAVGCGKEGYSEVTHEGDTQGDTQWSSCSRAELSGVLEALNVEVLSVQVLTLAQRLPSLVDHLNCRCPTTRVLGYSYYF
jgi:hypothetical protein